MGISTNLLALKLCCLVLIGSRPWSRHLSDTLNLNEIILIIYFYQYCTKHGHKGGYLNINDKSIRSYTVFFGTFNNVFGFLDQSVMKSSERDPQMSIGHLQIGTPDFHRRPLYLIDNPLKL